MGWRSHPTSAIVRPVSAFDERAVPAQCRRLCWRSDTLGRGAPNSRYVSTGRRASLLNDVDLRFRWAH
jgi:hypothetical protein